MKFKFTGEEWTRSDYYLRVKTIKELLICYPFNSNWISIEIIVELIGFILMNLNIELSIIFSA